jgi:hypothetical protein
VGLNITSYAGGMGGAGTCSTITGQRVFYAGGGGGGVWTTEGNPGLGSAGGGNGGGAYNTKGSGYPATNNTGSGGGGCSMINTVGDAGGGNGGSGIVIIRYPQTLSPPTAVTGNVQIGYAAEYQIYTWTSSGTVTF